MTAGLVRRDFGALALPECFADARGEPGLRVK